jgi:hypothetical protein
VPLGPVVVRARMTSASGQATVTFYTAPAGNINVPFTSSPWAQLGTPQSPFGTAIFSGTAPVVIGYNSDLTTDYPAYGGLAGKVAEFQMRSFSGNYSDVYTDTYGAAPGGQVVADAGFSAQPEGTTGFTDSAGNAWSTTGTAEISKRSYRFHGEMSVLPAEWDVTGTDIYAPIQAGGLLRRLSQGS